MGHDSFIWDMPPSYVTCLLHKWHDSFICDTTHSQMTCHILMWYALFIHDMIHSYVTWLIHMWHDSFICDMTCAFECACHKWHVTWLIHLIHMICDMTHSYHMWHGSFICDMRIQMCDMRMRMSQIMSHIWMCHNLWHGSFICDTSAFECACHKWMSHVEYEWILCICDMAHSFVTCAFIACLIRTWDAAFFLTWHDLLLTSHGISIRVTHYRALKPKTPASFQ